MIWTKEQAKALIDRALSFSKAEETQVSLNGGDRANVRFARNSASTSGASSGYSLAIAAGFGKKAGIVTTPGNGFGAPGEGYIRMTVCTSKDRLAEAVERIKKAGF